MPTLLHTLKDLDERATLCGCIGVKEKAHYTLLYHKDAKNLADSLINVLNSNCTQHRINWDHFQDGTDKITVMGMQQEKRSDGYFAGHNILFVASFHNNAETLSQFHVLHYLCNQQRPASITILLPFFPTGTLERIAPGEEGLVPTAATLASMFNTLPFQGGVRVMTYDVHALAEKFFFYGRATLTTHSAIPLLLQKLEETQIQHVVFPDDGAKKRFEKLFNPNNGKHFFVLSCSKEHVGDGVEKKTKVEGGKRLDGAHAIIVDDMTRSGNTLFECKKAIKAIGATNVSFFVTHGAFTSAFWKNIRENDLQEQERIYTTDSIMSVYQGIDKNAGNKKQYFEVLPLARQIIQDLHTN
jgi:phosphoribosylpyrophosphate synthetase